MDFYVKIITFNIIPLVAQQLFLKKAPPPFAKL